MAKYGRTPDQITVLPGVMPIIGSTEAEARDKLSLLQSWLTPTNALTLVTSRIGYDVTGFPLDGPGAGSTARREQPDLLARALRDGATREHDPARSLQPDRGGPRPLGPLRDPQAHRRHAGGMVRRGSRGRLQRPAPYFPGALVDFVDLVVPELQARGLFRREYEGTTLRDHFGLPRVPAPAR